MNAFCEHHQDSIRFAYSCFDRMVLNGYIPMLIPPERAHGFFTHHRQIYPVTRKVLRDIAERYHVWVAEQARRWQVEIFEDSAERRKNFMTPYFRHAQPDQIVAIIKAREPANILVSIGSGQGWHLERKLRWVLQYNFYLQDREFGRMFVRMCPYFPFSARVCLNQHNWLAEQLQRREIRFRQSENSFTSCSSPEILQELADSLTPAQLIACTTRWLNYLCPFFTAEERNEHGCHHQLSLAQVEYCHNLIFDRRGVLDALQGRLLDLNRSIGQPNKLTTLFGRRINKVYRGRLQTTIEDLELESPVMRSYYKSSSAKQYVRDHQNLRTELSSNDVRDLGVNKRVENLHALRQKCQEVMDNYLNIQQDVLETFLDRGELQRLSQPTILPNGKRVPGLKTTHPRQLALMHALVRFAHIVAGSVFTTAELYPHVLRTLQCPPSQYKLGSLRYDLSKLRAKQLVQKIAHTRRYQLTQKGYRLCVAYLKLFEKFYAPLASAMLEPVPADSKIPAQRLGALDKLYLGVTRALDRLAKHVGLGVAA